MLVRGFEWPKTDSEVFFSLRPTCLYPVTRLIRVGLSFFQYLDSKFISFCYNMSCYAALYNDSLTQCFTLHEIASPRSSTANHTPPTGMNAIHIISPTTTISINRSIAIGFRRRSPSPRRKRRASPRWRRRRSRDPLTTRVSPWSAGSWAALSGSGCASWWRGAGTGAGIW